jgi:hypothetical protein
MYRFHTPWPAALVGYPYFLHGVVMSVNEVTGNSGKEGFLFVSTARPALKIIQFVNLFQYTD